jgi:hypothetical protein
MTRKDLREVRKLRAFQANNSKGAIFNGVLPLARQCSIG